MENSSTSSKLADQLANEGLDLELQTSTLQRLSKHLKSSSEDSKQMLQHLHIKTSDIINNCNSHGLLTQTGSFEKAPTSVAIEAQGTFQMYSDFMKQDEMEVNPEIRLVRSPHDEPRQWLANGISSNIFDHVYTLRPDGKITSNTRTHGQPETEVLRAPSFASQLIDEIIVFNEAVTSKQFTNK